MKLWMFVSELTNFSHFPFDHENHDFWYNKIIGLLIIPHLQDQKQNAGMVERSLSQSRSRYCH